jgi:C-terminal processing protease CtpA/Prc
MSLYNFNGIIQADDIVEGSPADKSGLKNGDIIIGINNDFSNDIEKYKNLLQRTGETVNLLIKRDNVPIIISMRVRRIR